MRVHLEYLMSTGKKTPCFLVVTVGGGVIHQEHYASLDAASFSYYHIWKMILKVERMDFKDLPLHVNDKDDLFRAFCLHRLKEG